MALVPDSGMSLSFSVQGMLAKAQRAVGDFLAPPIHSPEYDLLQGPMRDARLQPRVPMSNADIDAGLLNQLSGIGLKRAKLVTAETHPDLMRAWRVMSKRAGLENPPQLIIAESDSLNALTISKDEVTITTGLLKILDLREAVAVLGHELGHVQSDHVTSRLSSMAILGGTGAVLGNELGRQGGANFLLAKLGTKMPFFARMQDKMYGAENIGRSSSVLGSLIYIGAGWSVGGLIARHFTVKPTELDADKKGARISGDPDGLASALEQLQAHSPRTGFMSKLAQLQSGYPTTERRIKTLRSMPMGEPAMAEIEDKPADTLEPVPMHDKQPGISVQGITGAERVGAAPESPALA